MRIYDISLTISPAMPVWPGDPPVILERVSKMENGASANVTQVRMGVHVGTHVDAPYHFLGGEAPTVETLSLTVLTGRVHVFQFSDQVESITAELLQELNFPRRCQRVLFKTRNSQLWIRDERQFQTDFVAISDDGAQFLVDRGIQLVGVDYLSVAPYSDGIPTHQTLLKAGIVIVEGLDLSRVQPGIYTLYCLPLKFAGSDGAPARTILVG